VPQTALSTKALDLWAHCLLFLHAGVLISFSCREAKAAVTFTIFLLVTKGLCPVFLH
jgi:hypothetical protein